MARRAWLGITTILILVSALALLRWCAPPPPPPPPPNYKVPGNEGEARPPRVNRDLTVTINPSGSSFNDEALTALRCGTPYVLAATVQQQVPNCAGYDFGPMMDTLSEPLLRRIDQLTCEETCLDKQQRTIYFKTSCRGTTASVRRKELVVCVRPGDARPAPGVPVPTGSNITVSTEMAVPGEGGAFDPPTRRGELVQDTVVIGTSTATWDFPCPDSQLVAYRYEEFVRGGCEMVADYQPFVDRAKARFDSQFYACVRCLTGCAPEKRVLRTEWDCDRASNNVRVRLWVQIICRKR